MNIINPVTGQDSESHAASTSSGMAAAREVRGKYLSGIINGEMKLIDVIEFSKGKLHENAKYLSKLRLSDILRAKPGWNESTAIEALERNGFSRTDNLQSIRRAERKVTLFIKLFDTTMDRWKTRPETPSDWPWFGKLKTLIEIAEEPVPSELLPKIQQLDDSDLDELFTGDSSETFDDDLNELLGG